jgi:phage terminase small subunit
MGTRGLTPKQQVFVREYLLDANTRRAAIRAGYSAKSADRYAYDLRYRPAVAAAIQAAQDRRAAAVGIEATEVVGELSGIAFAHVEVGGQMTYRDKLRALALLGRHLGMFGSREGPSELDMTTRVEIIVQAGGNT